MKIVIDKTIPFIEGVFEPYADVIYLLPEEIRPEDIRDASALMVRSRVRCDEALLKDSGVKIISKPSIGTDNIDIEYCNAHGIFVSNASGSNSGGVMNYVFSALYGIAARRGISLDGMTIGIVGLGHSGSKVQNTARLLGFKTLACDPKREQEEHSAEFCDIDYLLRNSDIVTLHLPLNARTKGLANSEFFSKMKLGAIFINASRGEIVDEEALIDARQKLSTIIIDTWANEPNINKELLKIADIATPHVAGYSYQGKQRSTAMAVKAVARYFGIKELFDFFPVSEVEGLQSVKLELSGRTQGDIASVLQYNYPIFTDDFMFRINPDNFLEMRRNYRYRREFIIL